MKAERIILKRGFLAGIFLLMFASLVLAIDVSITPQHLSLRDDNNPWVRCFVSGVDADKLSADDCVLWVLEEQIFAVRVKDCEPDVIVFFDRDEVRAVLSEAGAKGDVELALSITLPDGTVLECSDTIKVTK